jgi:hypothetical protein
MANRLASRFARKKQKTCVGTTKTTQKIESKVTAGKEAAQAEEKT